MNKQLTKKDKTNIMNAYLRHLEELKDLTKEELKDLFQSKGCGPTKRQAIIQLVQEKNIEENITKNEIDNTN